MTEQRWSQLPDADLGEGGMTPDDQGPWVKVEDVARFIRVALRNREITYADGSTERLCSDWCWEHALTGVMEFLGEEPE